MNDFLVIVGKPSTDMVSCSVVWPPPVDIWPHTAAKLFSQYWCPLGPFTFADVARVNSSLQPLQHMVKTDANPSLFLFVYHYVVIGLATGCVIGNEF